ncbi:MAG: Rpn family recombination-promoting nuclease/putative transposase [Candidatus Midichloria sp.]|nr:Rpn family recombination-promoting nuclease/putative transposase [Candidatus Midichloria sp.]
MEKGGEYEDLKEVIFLAITEYIMFPNKPGYLSEHVILDKKTYEHDLKGFSYTFIELPKFKKDIEELESGIERWCYFFKHL